MDLTATVCATSSAAAACKPLRHNFNALVSSVKENRSLKAPIAALSAAVSALERATESAAAAASAAAAGYAAEMACAASATREAEAERKNYIKGEEHRGTVSGSLQASKPDYQDLDDTSLRNQSIQPPEQPLPFLSDPGDTGASTHAVGSGDSGGAQREASSRSADECRIHSEAMDLHNSSRVTGFPQGQDEMPNRYQAGECLPLNQGMPSKPGKISEIIDGSNDGYQPSNGDAETSADRELANTSGVSGAIDHNGNSVEAEATSVAEVTRRSLDERIQLLKHLLRNQNNHDVLHPYEEPPAHPGLLKSEDKEEQLASSDKDQSLNTKDESSGSEYVANSTEDSDDASGSQGLGIVPRHEVELHRDCDEGEVKHSHGAERPACKLCIGEETPCPHNSGPPAKSDVFILQKQSPRTQGDIPPHPLVLKHGTLETAIDTVPSDMKCMELVPGMTIRASILFDFMHKLANDVYGEMLEAVLALQTSQYWSLRCHRHGKAPKSCGRVKSKSKKCNCGWRVCMRVINEQETIAAKQHAPTEEEREAQIRVAVLRINSFYPNHTGHEPEPYLRGPGIVPSRKRREHPVPLPITSARLRR